MMSANAPIFQIKSLKEFKKIGFITPSSNVALEIITSAILEQLPLVSAHYSRVPVTTTNLSAGAATQFTPDRLLQCAELIANCPVQTLLWNGTSESWTGEGYEAGIRVKELIEQHTKLPASTSSLAQLDVLEAWKYTKIALATPYTEEPNIRLKAFYASRGIDVVNDSRLNDTVNNDIADTSLDTMRQLIRDADHPSAQCIVVPRTTLRMDVPLHNCHVDRVCAEALAPGIASLRPNTGLNQRAIETCRHINETGLLLAQADTVNAAIRPPDALMSVYGVKAQMLLPLMLREGWAGAWISVHWIPGTREWEEGEVQALLRAGWEVCEILKNAGWAEFTVKEKMA